MSGAGGIALGVGFGSWINQFQQFYILLCIRIDDERSEVIVLVDTTTVNSITNPVKIPCSLASSIYSTRRFGIKHLSLCFVPLDCINNTSHTCLLSSIGSINGTGTTWRISGSFHIKPSQKPSFMLQWWYLCFVSPPSSLPVNSFAAFLCLPPNPTWYSCHSSNKLFKLELRLAGAAPNHRFHKLFTNDEELYNFGVIQSAKITKGELKKKHIAISYHYVLREAIAVNAHWSRRYVNFADLCTKALGTTIFHDMVHDVMAWMSLVWE